MILWGDLLVKAIIKMNWQELAIGGGQDEQGRAERDEIERFDARRTAALLQQDRHRIVVVSGGLPGNQLKWPLFD